MRARPHTKRLPTVRFLPVRWLCCAWLVTLLPVRSLAGSPLDEIPAFAPFALAICRDAEALRRLRPVQDPLPQQRRALEALAVFGVSPPNAPRVPNPLTARLVTQRPDGTAGIVVRQTAVTVRTVPLRCLADRPLSPPPVRLLVCRSTATAPPISTTIDPKPRAQRLPWTPSAFARLTSSSPVFALPLAAMRPAADVSSGALSLRTVSLHTESAGGGLLSLQPFSSFHLPGLPGPPATLPFTLAAGAASRTASRESAVALDPFGVTRLPASPAGPLPRACYAITPLPDGAAYTRRISAMLLESLIAAVRAGQLNARMPEVRMELLRGLLDQPFTRQAYDVFAALCETVHGSGERRRVAALREWVAEQHLPGADTLVLYYCSLRAYENNAAELSLALADEYFASAGANRARARLLQAMCHVRANRFNEARRALTDATVTQGGDELAAEGAFLLGWIDFQEGHTAQARAALAGVVATYPKAPAALRARNALANLAEGNGQ